MARTAHLQPLSGLRPHVLRCRWPLQALLLLTVASRTVARRYNPVAFEDLSSGALGRGGRTRQKLHPAVVSVDSAASVLEAPMPTQPAANASKRKKAIKKTPARDKTKPARSRPKATCPDPCPFEVEPGTRKPKIMMVGTRTGVHMTTAEACEAIKQSNFRVGSRGLYGPGIYFADSCGLGYHKMDAKNREDAKSAGGLCCIKAELQMGKAILPLPGRPGRADWLTPAMLKHFGAESVYAKVGPGGESSSPEFVVFSPDRVKVLSTDQYDEARAITEMNAAKEAMGQRLAPPPPPPGVVTKEEPTPDSRRRQQARKQRKGVLGKLGGIAKGIAELRAHNTA